MAKKFQLQIPEPCHESWDKMTPVEQGRFCNSCQKAVVDFTGMSDAQLIAFFKKPSTGSVCGRFFNDQLGRDISIPGKRMPWLKYVLHLLIPAFLISTRAKSQGKPIPILTSESALIDTSRSLKAQNENCSSRQQPSETKKVKGRLVDDRGNGIPHASVIIKGAQRGSVSDTEGNFSIDPFIAQSKAILVFSSIGYVTKEIVVDTVNKKSTCNIGTIPLNIDIKGQIVTVGIINPKKKKPTVKVFQQIFRDTASKSFRVFPNPASTGTEIKIEGKRMVSGDYIIDLYNLQGQLIKSSTIKIEEGKRLVTFELPRTTSGSYVLRLTNEKSGKTYTEKIIIQ